MGKLKKRKEDNTIGKQMPSAYEAKKLQQEEAKIALEKAMKMEKPVKYLTKRFDIKK